MKKVYLLLLLLLQTGAGYLMAQNVGINATGALPDPKAMLDISSTSSGLLIPRMTTVQRDAIASPTVGLQVFNLTTNTLDIYRGTGWESTGFTNPGTNVVHVYSPADLPAPVSGAITLVTGKVYLFSGLVNISPNYINLNGASVQGTNPVGDGVASSVSGAVLRSTDQHVYIEKMLVILASTTTTAYDFSDATGTKSCNLITGNNVKPYPGNAALLTGPGVGQVSGFRAVIVLQNYFDVSDGLKVTGTMGRLVLGFNLFGSIIAGKSAVEFLPGLKVDDVDLSNNHFIYTGTGQTGIMLDAGAGVDRGRMSSNMFRNVSTPISGFDGGSPGWSMQQNSGVPNTHAYGFLYMNNNTVATGFSSTTGFYRINGTTTLINAQKFTAANNQLTYIGKSPTTVRIVAIVGGRSPQAGSDYSIYIAKNGTVATVPEASIGAMLSGQGFQIVLESQVDMTTGDYVEIGIRNNANTASVVISDLQFRATEQ